MSYTELAMTKLLILVIFFCLLAAFCFIRAVWRAGILDNLDWPRAAIWLIPIILLISAVFKLSQSYNPLSYNYYHFLLITVSIAAIYITIFEYKLKEKITIWSIVFALITIIFNPLIVFNWKNSEEIFLITALVFIFHLAIKIKLKQLRDR